MNSSGVRAGVGGGGVAAGVRLPLRSDRHPPPGAEHLNAQWREQVFASKRKRLSELAGELARLLISGRQPLIAPAAPPPPQTPALPIQLQIQQNNT